MATDVHNTMSVRHWPGIKAHTYILSTHKCSQAPNIQSVHSGLSLSLIAVLGAADQMNTARAHIQHSGAESGPAQAPASSSHTFLPTLRTPSATADLSSAHLSRPSSHDVVESRRELAHPFPKVCPGTASRWLLHDIGHREFKSALVDLILAPLTIRCLLRGDVSASTGCGWHAAVARRWAPWSTEVSASMNPARRTTAHGVERST